MAFGAGARGLLHFDGLIETRDRAVLARVFNFAAVFVVLAFGVIVLIIGDPNPRIDGREGRVRPSRTGKTWVSYRQEGFNEDRPNSWFKSPEAAAEFHLAFGLTCSRTEERPMAGLKDKRGFIDKERLDLTERKAVEYWMKRWGVTRDQITAAHRKVGRLTRDIAAELGKKR